MKQHFINTKYEVAFDDYCQKCFEKDFKKKYKKNWDVTRDSIVAALERIHNFSQTELIDVICDSNESTKLVKYDFKVAKTKESAKTSGNRCILSVCNETEVVTVLLIYSKNHIGRKKGQETLWWKEIIDVEYGLVCV